MRPILDALESRIVMSSGLSNPPSTFDSPVSIADLNLVSRHEWTLDGTSGFGRWIDLTDDGQTMVAASLSQDDSYLHGEGAVRVFGKTKEGWVQTSQIGVGDDGPYWVAAQNVAISGDGSTVVAMLHDPSTAASVYVFEWNGSTWDQRQVFTAVAAGDATFGRSLTINADGSVIAIGVPQIHEGGLTLVYTKDAESWTQSAVLVNPEPSRGVRFGHALAIDSAGDTLVVGAPDWDDGYPKPGVGAAYVYQFSDGQWTLAHEEVATGETPGANLGRSVAITADGSLAIIGGSIITYEGQPRSAVRTLTANGSTWETTAPATLSDYPETEYAPIAIELAIAPDGSYAVATSRSSIVPGAERAPASAYLFRRTETGWAAGESLISESDIPDLRNSLYGNSVATAAGTIVVGEGEWYRPGSIYTYELSTDPRIFDGPHDQTVVVGRTATFFASASVPGLSARWQVLAADSTEWVDVPGATDAATVGDVTQSWHAFATAPGDSGARYRVVFHDGVEDLTVSNSARLQTDRVNARVDLDVSPRLPTINEPITITVRVSTTVPGMPTPNGGSVSLYFDGLGHSQTQLVDGEAKFVVRNLTTPRTIRLFASYQGDTYTAQADSSNMNLDVGRGPARLTAEVPAEARAGQAVDLTAVVAPIDGGGPPAGGVVFLNGGQPFAFVQLTHSGGRSTARYSTTLPVGDHYFQWVYLGDPKTAAASSGVYKVTVKSGGAVSGELAQPFGLPNNPASPPRTEQPQPADANDDAVYDGEAVWFTIPAGGDHQSIQWQVQESEDDAWIDVPGATDARYQRVAAPADDGRKFRAVSIERDGSVETTEPVTLNVVALQPILRFASFTEYMDTGTPSHIDVTAAPPILNHPMPTGSLRLTIGALEMTAALQNGRAQFAFPSPATLPGPTPLTIAYEGSAPLDASTETTELYHVRRSQPQMTPIVDLTPSSQFGFQIGAVLSSPWKTPAPLGGVLILDGGVPIALVPLVQETSNRSRAVLNADWIAPGRHYFQFVYLGDPNTLAATSRVFNVVKPLRAVPQTFFATASTVLNSATADVAPHAVSAATTTAFVASPVATNLPMASPSVQESPPRRTPVWTARSVLRRFATPPDASLAGAARVGWGRRSFGLFGE